jgi:hypothetical protein
MAVRCKTKDTKRTPYAEAVARLNCYQLAGQAVVGHVLGWLIQGLGDGRGDTRILFEVPRSLEDSGTALRVLTAGTVAAIIHQKAVENQGYQSRWEARAYEANWAIPLSIQAECKVPCEDPNSTFGVVQMLAAKVCSGQQEVVAEIQQAEQDAEALLHQHWQAVSHIATALLQSTTGWLGRWRLLGLFQGLQIASRPRTKVKFTGCLTNLADWVGEKLTEAHRGTFVEHRKLIVFENRSLGKTYAIRQADLVSSVLQELGYEIEGLSFGSDGEKGETWVLVASGISENSLEAQVPELYSWVQEAWREVCCPDEDCGSYLAEQNQITLEVLLGRPRLPKTLLMPAK